MSRIYPGVPACVCARGHEWYIPASGGACEKVCRWCGTQLHGARYMLLEEQPGAEIDRWWAWSESLLQRALPGV